MHAISQLMQRVERLESELQTLRGAKSASWIRAKGGGGSSEAAIVKTSGSGIGALSGDTPGSATCTGYQVGSGGDLETSGENPTVYNPWPVAIPPNYYVLAMLEKSSEKWVVVWPGLLNVRWVDPDLEQTLDGSTYTNIDTAEDCI